MMAFQRAFRSVLLPAFDIALVLVGTLSIVGPVVVTVNQSLATPLALGLVSPLVVVLTLATTALFRTLDWSQEALGYYLSAAVMGTIAWTLAAAVLGSLTVTLEDPLGVWTPGLIMGLPIYYALVK